MQYTAVMFSILLVSSVFTWILIFIASLFILIKASDYFVDSAETIGLHIGLPSFIVGVTIVSIGTSLPELITAVYAVSKNAPGIVVGNAVGSNIVNIFLVLGLASISCRRTLRVTHELIHVDLPLLVGSAFFLAVTIWDGVLTLAEALLYIAGLILYLLYTIHTEKQSADTAIKETENEPKKREFSWKIIVVLIGSAFFIYLGAVYTVESVIKLSELLNIARAIIAVSVVAFGTSAPELVVSIKAARNGKSEIAIGNVLGSNIFNIFGVMGIAGLFGTLIIPQDILSFALPMMLVATILYFFIAQDREITQWEGGILLLFYIFFIGKLFNLF